MQKLIVLLLGVASMLSVTNAAIAAPETYVIEPKHTMPRFEYDHLGYSTQTSRFDKTSGKIVIDRANKTGSVDIVIDAKSVNTGSDLFNQHIQAEDFFHTEKYPEITFKADSIKFEQDKPVAVPGKLTIKGVSRDVTLAIKSFKCMPHPMVKKDACGANASAQIKRSEFNMSKHTPFVSDEVLLTIPVEAIKE